LRGKAGHHCRAGQNLPRNFSWQVSRPGASIAAAGKPGNPAKRPMKVETRRRGARFRLHLFKTL
jgi:hypothetical protein